MDELSLKIINTKFTYCFIFANNIKVDIVCKFVNEDTRQKDSMKNKMKIIIHN